jgi:ribokinase
MRIYVVGSANIDLVVRAPHLPRPGQTVLGSDLLRTPGGKGANQAVAAARLGAAVRFVGAVGADPFGTELADGLRAAGVDVSHLVTLPERASGTALIVVDDAGENQITVAPGANAALTTSHVAVGLAMLESSDVVLLQLEIPLECVRHAAQLAHDRGARVCLNAAPAAPLSDDVLGLVDVLIVNTTEAATLSGLTDPAAAASALLRHGPRTVIVTLGADGVLVCDADSAGQIAAQRVDVVDTTAAGDAFCGALAAALTEGKSSLEAARFANVAAALATARIGAQASLPTRAEVEAFIHAEAPA